MKKYLVLSLLIMFNMFFPKTNIFPLKLQQMAMKSPPPQIRVTFMQQNNRILIRGEVIDDQKVVSVSINGNVLQYPEGKVVNLNEIVGLGEGTNTIKIEAVDNKGNASYMTKVVNYYSQTNTVENVKEIQQEAVRIGKPMVVAVLGFTCQCESSVLDNVSKIIAESLTTVLGKTKRFTLVERSHLEKILGEQKLGISGFVDEQSAAKIGKLISADSVVIGAISELGESLRIDIRLVDVETGGVMYTEFLQSAGKSSQSINGVLEKIAQRIRVGFPVIEDKVIKINGDEILIGIGRELGLLPGVKLTCYREGEEIISGGKSYGREIKIVGELQVVEVFEKYSSAKMIRQETGNFILLGDKVVTK